MTLAFKKIWDKELKLNGYPDKFAGTLKISYEELKKYKEEYNQEKAADLVKKLVKGYVLIVKEAFSDQLVNEIKKKTINFWKNNPSTFHKMVEGCPDYHRVITPETAKNYSVGAVRHTTYFFKWNNDPCNFNEKIYERWRYSKFVAGLGFNQFENNTPKDGSVDRIQIVCYPPKYGGVEVHKDTISNSPLAISCYLSSINVDFKSGGFYCVDNKNNKVNLENEISAGDLSLYCATIDHGVDPIDPNINVKDYDWYSGVGRWWMGLFTNDSNLKKNRNTSLSLDKYHSENIIETRS